MYVYIYIYNQSPSNGLFRLSGGIPGMKAVGGAMQSMVQGTTWAMTSVSRLTKRNGTTDVGHRNGEIYNVYIYMQLYIYIYIYIYTCNYVYIYIYINL